MYYEFIFFTESELRINEKKYSCETLFFNVTCANKNCKYFMILELLSRIFKPAYMHYGIFVSKYNVSTTTVVVTDWTKGFLKINEGINMRNFQILYSVYLSVFVTSFQYFDKLSCLFHNKYLY